MDERKAIGLDEVSGYFLNECRQEMAEPIECSIKTGKVPKELKRADIMPIYKNGNKVKPFNYRPVSLNTIVYIICEKVIKKQLNEYLEREEIITNRQFRFRTGRLCVTNLLSFYSRIIDITQERNGWTDCLYLNLEKAFDKVRTRDYYGSWNTFEN